MKLVTFLRDGKERAGSLIEGGEIIVDLQESARLAKVQNYLKMDSIQNLIEGGEAALKEARFVQEFSERKKPPGAVFPIQSVKLLAPIPRPVKLRCFSVYEQHMIQALNGGIELKVGGWLANLNRKLHFLRIPKSWYKNPTYYKGNNTSISGPEDFVPYPYYEKWLDYELELALVIGRKGKNIPESKAMDYVFGYTCFNDFSARSRLFDEIISGKVGPVKGKDFDGGNSIGPCIVTKDEIPDPYALKMQVRLNGQVIGNSSSSGMSHSIKSMIHVASEEETLVPGEIFGTGAASNCSGIEHLEFLNPNDKIEIEIERIGILRNFILPKRKPDEI